MITKEPTINERVLLTNTILHEYTEIRHDNRLENCEIGAFSYTGEFCILQNVKVLNFSNIATMVRIGATDHPMSRVTLHHFTYRRKMFQMANEDDLEFFKERESRITTIGHDTWIGHGVSIKPGVNIGNGAVVGTGSIVTKDVPDYAIVVGNPAKILRYRFEPNQISALNQIQWWNWDYDTIKSRFDDFLLPIEEFIEKYKED